MLTLKQLRKDMQFNHELFDLINILKDIASSQFRHLQLKREYAVRFDRSLKDFFAMVDLIKSRHPFFVSRPSLPTAIVLITSDEGFLGALPAGITVRLFMPGLTNVESGSAVPFNMSDNPGD